MSAVLVVFEEEGVALPVDEITRVEMLQPEEQARKSHFGQHIPKGAETRVHTRTNGFFYVSKSFSDTVEWLTEIGLEVRHG